MLHSDDFLRGLDRLRELLLDLLELFADFNGLLLEIILEPLEEHVNQLLHSVLEFVFDQGGAHFEQRERDSDWELSHKLLVISYFVEQLGNLVHFGQN